MSGGAPLTLHTITRRPVGKKDVQISIKYAGICHSDIHQAREEWGKAIFPMVPGHEIAGEVVAVGDEVTKYKVGDKVGVGCMVDSCRNCPSCKAGDENYCQTGAIMTYNGKHKYQHCEEYNDEGGAPTYGGYSQGIVVDQNYVCKIPDGMDLAGAAPLLCAGITVYSPFMYYGLKPGMKLAVAGLGGLGAMAVLIGKAMGAEVTVLSRSPSKRDEALKELKADKFVVVTDEADAATVKSYFDFMINTIAADHDLAPYMDMLTYNGKQILVGVPPNPLSFHAFQLAVPRKTIAGSLIGGIKETQEMLDFCAKHGITCPHEVIPADPEKVNAAYERAVKSDVKYSFVIDTATFAWSSWWFGTTLPMSHFLRCFAPLQLTVFRHLHKEDMGGCKELFELPRSTAQLVLSVENKVSLARTLLLHPAATLSVPDKSAQVTSCKCVHG